MSQVINGKRSREGDTKENNENDQATNKPTKASVSLLAKQESAAVTGTRVILNLVLDPVLGIPLLVELIYQYWTPFQYCYALAYAPPTNKLSDEISVFLCCDSLHDAQSALAQLALHYASDPPKKMILPHFRLADYELKYNQEAIKSIDDPDVSCVSHMYGDDCDEGRLGDDCLQTFIEFPVIGYRFAGWSGWSLPRLDFRSYGPGIFWVIKVPRENLLNHLITITESICDDVIC